MRRHRWARSRARRARSATSIRASTCSSSRTSMHGGNGCGLACSRMATDPDRDAVARQLGREPRGFRRVVVRCPFGRPAVTEQHPYAPDGEPFPTTYYVTCRHLVAAISRLEAAGGVEQWTERAERDPMLAASRARADERQREIRRELAGGETGRAGSPLKCLHAHAAFALAHPGYELGERIVAELDPLWPDECCSDPR